jgi:hypothetical protein
MQGSPQRMMKQARQASTKLSISGVSQDLSIHSPAEPGNISPLPIAARSAIRYPLSGLGRWLCQFQFLLGEIRESNHAEASSSTGRMKLMMLHSLDGGVVLAPYYDASEQKARRSIRHRLFWWIEYGIHPAAYYFWHS